MKKLYFIPLLFLLLFTLNVTAQEVKQQSKIQESTIEGLSLYPNPVTNGRVYIATKNDAEKEIQIFDVLGKKIFQSQLNTRELNISSLSPGVYIIKIREEESTATRKLIIR
jgi:adenylate kinase family enzyme